MTFPCVEHPPRARAQAYGWGVEIDAEPLARLHERTSSKWTRYAPDVLPLPVAEMDYPLAPAIKQALMQAVERSDTGYNKNSLPVAEAFAGFAERHWNWQLDPSMVTVTADVVMGLVESLRMVTKPGDSIVICPPVYFPFFALGPEIGCTTVEVPLTGTIAEGWEMDFAGIEAAFAQGARALVLCSPHNPVGRVWTAAELERLLLLAERYDAWIIADEIHGPLSYAEHRFVPILTVPGGDEHALSVSSASKSFNLAGLKCAHITAGSPRGKALLDGLPMEVEWRAAHFGVIANTVAFREGDEWLAAVLRRLDENRRLLAELLRSHLPLARYRLPEATYLGWIDLSEYPEFGDDPSAVALAKAKLALSIGPDFGRQGLKHTRINFACAPDTLSEAVERLASILA